MGGINSKRKNKKEIKQAIGRVIMEIRVKMLEKESKMKTKKKELMAGNVMREKK